MTEEEKKKLAMELFAQETARLSSHRAFDIHTTISSSALRRMEQRQSIMSSLAQRGITWEQLRDAYNEELQRGQQEMMGFRLSFFYAASAIVYKEQIPESSPQSVADFIAALQTAPKDTEDTEVLVQKCLGLSQNEAAFFEYKKGYTSHTRRSQIRQADWRSQPLPASVTIARDAR